MSPLTEAPPFGVVLTGGASRRMGRTKALVEIDGVPMAAMVAASLRAAGCVRVVAVGGDPGELAALDLPVLPDDHPGEGPLTGLATAMRVFEMHGLADLLVVACDLPFVGPADLGRLVQAAREHPDVDVAVARTGHREPACAVWRPSSRSAVGVAFDAGERAVHRVLDSLVVVEVPVSASALRNINTPDDVDRYP